MRVQVGSFATLPGRSQRIGKDKRPIRAQNFFPVESYTERTASEYILAQSNANELKGYWPLGESSGPAYDLNGSKHGTVGGTVTRASATLTTSNTDTEGCIDLGNNSGYVEIPHIRLKANQAATYVCWVQPDSITADDVIFNHSNICTGSLLSNGARFNIGGVNADYTGGALSTSAPILLFFHYDGYSARIFDCDSGGVSMLAFTAGPITYGETNSKVWLGGVDFGGPIPSFDGKIDEFMLYGRNLSTTEMAALYSQYGNAKNNSSSYGKLVVSDYPIAYWKMDDGGVYCGDIYNRINGLATPTALTPVTGLLPTLSDANGAYDFNGSTQGIAIADTDRLDFGDKFSIEAWFKRGNTNTGEDGAIWDSGAQGVVVRFEGSGGEAGKLKIRKNSSADIAFSTGTILDMNTHHLVVTKHGTTVKMYIDGVDVTGSVTNSTIANTALTKNIGAADNATSSTFDGVIDEVAIYEYPMSYGQVWEHYQAGVGSTLDTTAPTINITVDPDRTRISQVSGKDQFTFTFQVNEAYQAYKIKAVPSDISDHSSGVQLESGGSGSPASDVVVTITDDEMTGAGLSQGNHVIKIFAQDTAGNWSA